MAARVRMELDRADLTSHQRRLMQIILWATVMKRRLRVRVGRLEELEEVAGMHRGHLSTNLRQLAKMRLIQIVSLADGGTEFVLLPDSSAWDVGWLYSRAAWMKLHGNLDAFTNQVQRDLLPPEPNLLAALAEVSSDSWIQNLDPDPESGSGGVGGALTVHGFTASEKESTEPLNREPLNSTWAPIQILDRVSPRLEARLMKRLQLFLANSPHQEDRDDMLNWGGDWRKNWVRKMPVQIAKALDILESENARGDWESYKSRGAALKDLAKRLPA
jgi:hypothetical protein